MKKLMMIVAMIGVIGMAGAALAAPPYLVDIVADRGQRTTPVGATAADFTAAGVVGLTGAEPVDTLNPGATTAVLIGPAGTYPTAGGINVYLGGPHGENNTTLTVGLSELFVDFLMIWTPDAPGPIDVTIGNVALDPSTKYRLYLWGNRNYLGGTGDEICEFTPVDGDVVFDSNTTTPEYLAVDFTTNAAWDDVNDTIDFTLARVTGFGDWNGFAITGPGGVVPEPAGLGLIGLALLAVRRKRS